jgi:hypothetical protein
MWLLNQFKQEQTRVTISPNIRSQPTNWGTVLDLEIGDRFTVQQTPLGSGNQNVSTQIIEGIGWTFSQFDISPTFKGSAVDPNVGSCCIFDDAQSGLFDSALFAY